MNISREQHNITPNGEAITVNFAKATRNYSRLRIATMPNKPITVSINKYTPAGSSDMKWNQQHMPLLLMKRAMPIYMVLSVHNSNVTVKYGGATFGNS